MWLVNFEEGGKGEGKAALCSELTSSHVSDHASLAPLQLQNLP